MSDKTITEISNQIRSAMITARNAGDFNGFIKMERFPKGSCLFASEILAEYLHRNGIETIIIQGSGSFYVGTHAWLAINQKSIEPKQICESIPDDVFAALQGYNPTQNLKKNVIRYEYDLDQIWLMDMIDITIDQFGSQYSSPYIGKALDLHKRYDIRVHNYDGVYDETLFAIVSKWLL